MKATFKHPKVYDDLLQLYRGYWHMHRHLPKPFRMTTGEMILHDITCCIKGVILANCVDKQVIAQRELAASHLRKVRADLVVVRGLLTVGWNMTFISHGAFRAPFGKRKLLYYKGFPGMSTPVLWFLSARQ